MLRRRYAAPLMVALLTLAAAPAGAQQGRGFLFRQPAAVVSVFGGFAMPRAGSDLFEFTTSELTLGRGDFAAADIGADLAFRVGERFELAFGVAHAKSNQRSEFRDWVDGDDQPIEQTTAFQRTPLSISLRYHPLSRGRTVGSFAWIPAQFDPWIGGGVGRMKYSFRQEGDFINFDDPDNPVVFTDRYTSEGWANLLQASAGAGWSLSPRLLLTGELRYIHSSAELSGDFVGFDRLDLSGLATSIGLAFRL